MIDLKSGLDTARVLRNYRDGTCIDFKFEFKIEEESERFDGTLLVYDGNPSRTMFRKEIKTRDGEQQHYLEEGEISDETSERLKEIHNYDMILDFLTTKQEPRKPADQK